MSVPEPARQDVETSALGTAGWVGVVLLLALVALGILSWLGPVGSR